MALLAAAFLFAGCASLPTPPLSGFVVAMAKTDADDSAKDNKIHTPQWLLLLPLAATGDILLAPFLMLNYFADRT